VIKLSVVILTFNEEKNIERCLSSIAELADEIVVIDSYSTDKTETICKKFNVRFVTHNFEGYIEQKNWAITQAHYQHILSLDADEALSEDLKKSILKVKSDWKFDGYYFNRLNNYCGKWIKHGAWYPDRKLRLWDSRKGFWTGTNPHDKFELQPNTSQAFLKGNLLHYSISTIEEHITQINKFSTIKAKAAFQKGEKSNICKIFCKPIIKFCTDYFIKLGILDGYYGFLISVLSATSIFLKYTKLKGLK
jgi:glycosyltransferase involved in cell wall biosynthesis